MPWSMAWLFTTTQSDGQADGTNRITSSKSDGQDNISKNIGDEGEDEEDEESDEESDEEEGSDLNSVACMRAALRVIAKENGVRMPYFSGDVRIGVQRSTIRTSSLIASFYTNYDLHREGMPSTEDIEKLRPSLGSEHPAGWYPQQCRLTPLCTGLPYTPAMEVKLAVTPNFIITTFILVLICLSVPMTIALHNRVFPIATNYTLRWGKPNTHDTFQDVCNNAAVIYIQMV
ncbi:hypothetical protein C8Q72DRAFT_342799 [Fomitopsis betulina]|nr:hypothetical protein C8Q72DRAFT_342799 [Fomitopsis betulina]